MIFVSKESRNHRLGSSPSFSSKVFRLLNMGCVSSKFLKKQSYVDDYDDGGSDRTTATRKASLNVKPDNSLAGIGFHQHYVSLTSTSYGLMRVESPTKYVEKKIKNDGKEETLTEMYTKLSTLEMDLTQVKPLNEEMGIMTSPVRIIPSPSSCGRNVGLSFGSPDYAVSETIDVGDMMMGLEEAASVSECSSSPLTYACKRSSLDTMHQNPKKLGKKARYAKDIIMTTCDDDDDDDDGDDVLINEFSVSQPQFSSRQPNFTSHAQMVQTKPGKKSRYGKEGTCDINDDDDDENVTNEFSISQSKFSSSRPPNFSHKKHNVRAVKKPKKLKNAVSEMISEEGFGDENAMPQQVQNIVKIAPSKDNTHTRSPLASVPLKRRESIAIANNRLLSSLDAIASLKSSPQALCPSTKHHVTMMTKYANPSPKSMMGSPLGQSGSSRRVLMGSSLLSSEPKKSSRRVLMGSTLIYSAPSSPLFDPDLVASYEEALEDTSWDKNHKENERQMQEVEKELSEVLYIYAPTSATTTGLDRNTYDPFLCFEEKCPPGGGNRIVLYTTTLRGIRKTFEDCNNARSILHGFDLIIDERDVSMHLGFLNELRELMGRVVSVPRLFVKGRYIGGIDEVGKLHEDGRLSELVEGFPRDVNKVVCDGCGGVRFIPCLECNGSCKVRKEEENSYLRCSQCNENGLIQCPICI